MAAEILDGKGCAERLLETLKDEIHRLGQTPKLVIVRVGDDPASLIYVNSKKKGCAKVGIEAQEIHLPAVASEPVLLKEIEKLNKDRSVHGVLVQLPLPKQIDARRVLDRLSPEKDVDGFHACDLGNLMLGGEGFEPCTPKGIIHLLKENGVTLEGKDVVIIGRSTIVGKPLAMLLCRENATVTLCHTKTKDLDSKTRNADIVVAAVGRAEMIRGDALKAGSVVVDVGMNRTADGRLVGDCHFESCSRVASKITPVPGGVGPMTVAMLLFNTVLACRRRNASAHS